MSGARSWIVRVANRDDNFLRHVLVLMSWTIVAQSISIASMLVLPRLFFPEQFGVFSLFSGLVVMLGVVAAGRYEYAIGLPRLDANAAAVFTLCMSLAALAFICWFITSKTLPIAAIAPELSALNPWWTLVALGAACIGWYNAATYMALRVSGFGLVGQSKALIAAVTAVGPIVGWLFVSREDGALIVPLLVGQLVGTLYLLWALSGRDLWKFERHLLVSVAKRYARFPKYFAPASLLDGFAVLLPVAAITVYYSPAEAGIYALADRALRVPVTLVGSSVFQVFYQRIAALREDPNASRRMLLRTWLQMAVLALLPCSALAVFGESVFAVLFGAVWRDSGRVAEIMVIGTFFLFISYPTSNILAVYEKAWSFLLWQAAQVAMVAGAIWIAFRTGSSSLRETVAWIIAAQTSGCLFSMVLQWRVVATRKRTLTNGSVTHADIA